MTTHENIKKSAQSGDQNKSQSQSRGHKKTTEDNEKSEKDISSAKQTGVGRGHSSKDSE